MWVKQFGLQYYVGVDGISVWLVMLTTFMMPIAILLSGGITKQVRLYVAASFVLETAVLGAFLSLDLLLFFIFFEMLLFPMFLLIGVWGSKRRIYASVKFFLFTMAGSAFLLVGIFVLYVQSAHQFGAGHVRHQPAAAAGSSRSATRAGCSSRSSSPSPSRPRCSRCTRGCRTRIPRRRRGLRRAGRPCC